MLLWVSLASLYINRRKYRISLGFWLFRKKFKLGVDALLDLSIIRPTSGADETENSLIIKELDEVSGEECFGSDA
jgi:hypothetical protein